MPSNNTTEQERTQLYRTIWQIANDLRGSVDGWDFKQYVLGMLFYRFISENLTHYINKHERKIDPNFDYAKLSDEVAERGRAEIVLEKGFYILPSELFVNVRARAKKRPEPQRNPCPRVSQHRKFGQRNRQRRRP